MIITTATITVITASKFRRNDPAPIVAYAFLLPVKSLGIILTVRVIIQPIAWNSDRTRNPIPLKIPPKIVEPRLFEILIPIAPKIIINPKRMITIVITGASSALAYAASWGITTLTMTKYRPTNKISTSK